MISVRAISTLVRHDARLQFRYRIYHAYAFVIAFYVVLLIGFRHNLPHWVPALVVFSDPAVLGFFFIGALMLLERAESSRSALALTPVSGADYLRSKAITLTGLALLAVTVLSAFFDTIANWPLLVTGVALTSVHFIGIGVFFARRFRSVTSYLMGSAAFLTPIVAPGFLALNPSMPAWLDIVPAVAQFRLILVASGSATADAAEIVFCLVVAALAAWGGAWLGAETLKTEFGRK